MLYWLFYSYLSDFYSGFNLFRYITFRAGGAVLTALLISFIMGPHIINLLKNTQVNGQPIRRDGPASHLTTKAGTPTMGGVLILLSCLGSILLWCDLHNCYVWTVIIVMLGFGLLGLYDDYLKLTRRNSKGISSRAKMAWQITLSVLVLFIIREIQDPQQFSNLYFPFFKNLFFDLGWFYFIFAACVIVGSSNAVNLTDGLDGLAIFPTILVAASFCIISYIIGNYIFANYLHLHFLPGCGELAVICATLIGAGLGFLWYNSPPAMVFMGDTGSLSLGATLGVISVITKQEIVLFIAGGLFVLETLSVIIQIFSYRLWQRRVFLMAPIHHHFEQKGWSEATIVIRFWIISVVFALVALSTLKIR